jgi:hypothetical protein
MLKGLLLQVLHWWMSGMVLMTLGAVILINVVATFGGGADTTLAVSATTLGDGGSSGASQCPVMMAVRF